MSSVLRSLVGRVGASWPRSRRLPRPLRWGNILENIGRDPETAYYADLCFLKPADARALQGLTPDRDPRQSAVYDAVTAPYRRCSSGSVLQGAEYARVKI